jgi:hypothetical protein
MSAKLKPAPKSQSTKALLPEYDAGAIQHIPAVVTLEGGRANVTLIYDPNAQEKTFDQHLDEYEMRAGIKTDDLPDDEVDAAVAQALLEAQCWLFDTVITDIEGIGAEGEERPVEWRSIAFSPERKKAVVEQAILYTLPMQAKAVAARPSWSSNFARSTTRLLCHFNGRELETFHTMKPADSKTLDEFRALWAKGGTGLQVASLYETLEGKGSGYKGGIIPRHHKASAVIGHCALQGRVIGKK